VEWESDAAVLDLRRREEAGGKIPKAELQGEMGLGVCALSETSH